MTMTTNEEWRQVKGFEGRYEVSDLGRVRSLKRGTKSGFIVRDEPLVMNPNTSSKGYKWVYLYKSDVKYFCAVHRLVAEAFVPNPKGYDEVNHKDEDKSNNRVENLEWCTREYNMNYGTCVERFTMNNPNRRDIEQYTVDGVLVGRYASSMDAHRQTGIDNSAITKCCLGRKYFKTAGGYVWRYVE